MDGSEPSFALKTAMPMPSHLSNALWLDPFRPLSAANRAQLADAGLEVQTLTTLDALQSALSASAQSAVVVLGMGADIELIQDTMALAQSAGRPVAVVCRTERRQLELAVQALHAGACHVLAADDWSAAAWNLALERAKQATARQPLAESSPVRNLAPNSVAAVRSVVYVDPVSRNLLALAQRVAQTPVAVLVEGPTGSGKEVLARVLHESSAAANGPFIGLNCAALPEHMIEDMLFGHEKGAFTGAVKEHRGLFEQAQGGTLFLDEIGELPLALQAKLLRVLQERSLVRLGGERAIALDVRVVAATNKNLREQINQRLFREDLYFRLSTFKLRVPALAERSGDILPLVARLLGRQMRSNQAWTVSEGAQRALLSYPWPGNVRELENIIQRAMVLCPDSHIDTQHLMFDDAPTSFLLSLEPHSDAELGMPATQVPSHIAVTSPLHATVKHSEHHAIRAALEASRSREEAAQKLGISPRTLRYKLARLRDTQANLATHS
jgi:two-component system response regulator FlrC